MLASERGNPKFTRVVTPTHRTSSRIPLVSPWDFGISNEWLNEQRNDPNIAPLLQDWGTHGDPEGLGIRAAAEGGSTEVGRVMDPRFDFGALDDTDE